MCTYTHTFSHPPLVLSTLSGFSQCRVLSAAVEPLALCRDIQQPWRLHTVVYCLPSVELTPPQRCMVAIEITHPARCHYSYYLRSQEKKECFMTLGSRVTPHFSSSGNSSCDKQKNSWCKSTDKVALETTWTSPFSVCHYYYESSFHWFKSPKNYTALYTRCWMTHFMNLGQRWHNLYCQTPPPALGGKQSWGGAGNDWCLTVGNMMRPSCSLSSELAAAVSATHPPSSDSEWNMARGTEKAKLGSWERFLWACRRKESLWGVSSLAIRRNKNCCYEVAMRLLWGCYVHVKLLLHWKWKEFRMNNSGKRCFNNSLQPSIVTIPTHSLVTNLLIS